MLKTDVLERDFCCPIRTKKTTTSACPANPLRFAFFLLPSQCRYHSLPVFPFQLVVCAEYITSSSCDSHKSHFFLVDSLRVLRIVGLASQQIDAGVFGVRNFDEDVAGLPLRPLSRRPRPALGPALLLVLVRRSVSGGRHHFAIEHRRH